MERETECLDQPPPRVTRAIEVTDREQGCPAPFALCFTEDAAKALVLYIYDMERWVVTAWERCHERPVQPTNRPDTSNPKIGRLDTAGRDRPGVRD